MTLSGTKYLAWCLSLTLALSCAVAAVNYYADPCGIYHYGKAGDWIHNRPFLTDNEFIHKAREVISEKPEILFLGNSRAAEGLDPHNPALPAPAYNLALHHGTIYEAWRYLQNACAAYTPKTVVMGIDLGWFAADLPSTNTFSEDRLLVRPDGRPTPALTYEFADVASTLFSLPTFELSLRTLFGHTKLPYSAGYAEEAPRVLEHMDQPHQVLAANRRWLGDASSTPYRDADGKSPQLDAFDHIVELCAEKNIHLIVFVHPLHAAMIDKYTENWALYCDWMKTVAARLESRPGLTAEFWDFAGYNSMNIEPFPAPTDTTSHMHFYWDGSHYHKIVGDMVLRRIFTGAGPQGFGQPVTTSTVDQDLQRLLAEKKAWHELGRVVPIDPNSSEIGRAK